MDYIQQLQHKAKRRKEILRMLLKGVKPAVIAAQMNITVQRVSQIKRGRK